MNQKLIRPTDYLVEMFKSDEVMQKIRSSLVNQQIKIQNFEEKKQRIENKKFAKKVLIPNFPNPLAPNNQSPRKTQRKEKESPSHREMEARNQEKGRRRRRP